VSLRPRRRLLPHGLLLALLLGMVVVPALLSLSVGIVALALWREAFDIVFGVLVLSFAASAIAGGVTAIGFVRRSARLAELQADFIANVSHELRTPLAGIRLVAETLEAGRGDEPGRLALLTEMLGEEVRRLEDLIERVLAWRHLDGIPDTVSLERIPVEELVQEAVSTVERLAESRGVEVRVALGEGLAPLLGDRAMLRHALGNLVHNAIKFGGPNGPVEIVAKPCRDAVEIVVRDRGPGIETRDLPRIFERFYRGTAHRFRVGGTGLGLSIVQGVVEAHGGQVGVQSQPGQGAAFSLRLPAAPRDGAGDGP
jgi:signal transduction histidine kinase